MPAAPTVVARPCTLRAALAGVTVVAAATLAACASSGSGSQAGSGPGGTFSTAAHTTFSMPDLTGKPLPAAEKAVQTQARNALFEINAQDATPAGRNPSPARAWKVCSQSIPVGQETDQTATLTLKVVRLGEACPR